MSADIKIVVGINTNVDWQHTELQQP